MKKIVLSWVLVACMVAAAAEFKHPGWACKDVQIFQDQLVLAKTALDKISMTYMIDFTVQPPTSFVDSCARIETAINAIAPDMAEDIRFDCKKKYSYCNNKWTEELVAYCMANPSNYDIYIVMKYGDDVLGKQRFFDLLLNAPMDPLYVQRAINSLVKQSIAGDLNDEEMKSLLKKLDVRYTNLLLVDKDKWAPIVAKIRTLLERF